MKPKTEHYLLLLALGCFAIYLLSNSPLEDGFDPVGDILRLLSSITG